jgi:hypothetical protein
MCEAFPSRRMQMKAGAGPHSRKRSLWRLCGSRRVDGAHTTGGVEVVSTEAWQGGHVGDPAIDKGYRLPSRLTLSADREKIVYDHPKAETHGH